MKVEYRVVLLNIRKSSQDSLLRGKLSQLTAPPKVVRLLCMFVSNGKNCWNTRKFWKQFGDKATTSSLSPQRWGGATNRETPGVRRGIQHAVQSHISAPLSNHLSSMHSSFHVQGSLLRLAILKQVGNTYLSKSLVCVLWRKFPRQN